MELKGKKILVVCTTDNMIWQFLLPHIARLEERGAVVECVSSRTGFWFDALAKRGLTMHEIGFERSPFKTANLGAWRALKKLVKNGGYDVIYCHQSVGGMLGRLVGKKYKIKVIYIAHGFFFWKGCPIKNKLLYRTAERFLAKRTDALVALNEEDYEAAFGMKAKRVYYTHGIGCAPRAAKNDCAVRQELGIGEDTPIVLTVSELIPRKNYPAMLRAFAALESTDAHYVICGTGSGREETERYAAELNLTERVHFLGYRLDVPEIMRQANVLLHLARHEGLPIAVVEAMTAGLPVVASDIRGCREMIEPQGGTLVPTDGSPKTVADALAFWLTNRDAVARAADFNSAKAELWLLPHVLDEYDRIFDEL